MRKNFYTTIKQLRHFLHSGKAVAASEFALIMPLLTAVVFGASAIAETINVHYKVEALTIAIADMVSQSSTLNTQSINNIFNTSRYIIYPVTPIESGIRISLASVNSFNNKISNVVWSRTIQPSSISAYGVNAAIDVESLYQQNIKNVIVVDASFRYRPSTSGAIFNGVYGGLNADGTKTVTTRVQRLPIYSNNVIYN